MRSESNRGQISIKYGIQIKSYSKTTAVFIRKRTSDRTPDPGEFQSLTGTFLSKDTFLMKFPRRSDQFSTIYEPNCGKCPISIVMLKNPKKSADDFQDLIRSSLSTDNLV